MNRKLTEALDDCIARASAGESIESCLGRYPDLAAELGPLLHLARSINIPTPSPTPEFTTRSKARLLARIRKDIPARHPRSSEPSLLERLLDLLAGRRRALVPVGTTLVILVGIVFLSAILLKPAPAPEVLASSGTLRIMQGSAQFQESPSGRWYDAADGMTVGAGARVKTAEDAHALLTFFDGSTLKLEPGTEIEIQQLEGDGQSATIVLKQWLGTTWSRVNRMLDAGSRYEINTPSATAAVRGTLFTTEVDASGATTVATTQGLVSVVARGEEVLLPPSEKTRVAAGAPPAPPAPAPPPSSALIVRIDGAAIGSVTDPTGSSVGKLPDGWTFNQITGARSAEAPGAQEIVIPHPRDGEYRLVLRYPAAGEARYTVEGRSGAVTYRHGGTHEGAAGAQQQVRMNLRVKDGGVVLEWVRETEDLKDKTPEKVTRQPVGAATPAGGAPATAPDLKKTQDKEPGAAMTPVNTKPAGGSPPVQSPQPPATGKPADDGKARDMGKPTATPDSGKGNDRKPPADDGKDKGKDDDKGKPADSGKKDDRHDTKSEGDKADKDSDDEDEGNEAKPDGERNTGREPRDTKKPAVDDSKGSGDGKRDGGDGKGDDNRKAGDDGKASGDSSKGSTTGGGSHGSGSGGGSGSSGGGGSSSGGGGGGGSSGKMK